MYPKRNPSACMPMCLHVYINIKYIHTDEHVLYIYINILTHEYTWYLCFFFTCPMYAPWMAAPY